MNKKYRFTVALSFAGDNKRSKIREVSEHLIKSLGEDKVFFDELYESELAGHDSQTVLQNIYKESTELVVACVCERYNKKPWTQEEWRAIQSFERTIRDADTNNYKRLRFLPLRFDDGKVDGIFDTAIVPDVRQCSSVEIANKILDRLDTLRSKHQSDSDAPQKTEGTPLPVNSTTYEDTTTISSEITTSSDKEGTAASERFSSFEFTDEFTTFINSTEIGYSHPRKDHINLDDVFVYQYLKQQGSDFEKLDEIIRSDSCLSFENITKTGVITVLGTEQSGKTSLSKTLVNRFHIEGRNAIWIDASTFTTRDFPKLLRRALRNQVTNLPNDIGHTWLKGTVVVIDNYNENKLNAKARSSLLDEFINLGAALLLFSDASIQFDEEQYAVIPGDTVYQLLLFGHELRDELISKWIRIGAEDTLSESDEKTRVKEVADHINLVVRKGVVPSKPLYILSIIQLLESSKASDHSLTSYGHSYLTLILSGFQKAGISQSEFDSHINLLTEYAFYLHKNELRFASEIQLSEFCTDYESRFFGLDPKKMFHNLVLAQLLTDRAGETGFSYRFIDYFYVAKYFSENITAPSVIDDLHLVFENLHTDRNANILIFLTHHSKEQGILDTLLDEVSKLFPGRNQVTLEKEVSVKLFDQLDCIPDLVKIQRTESEARQKQLQDKDKDEMLEHVSKEQLVGEDHVYDELSDDQSNWLIQINRSLRLIEIIGQIMRNRYGSMERQQLEQLANSTFQAGFTFLDLYLEALNEDEEHLVQVIEKLLSEHKDIQDSNIRASAKKFFLMLCYRACFSVISKISTSIGHGKLTKLYEQIEANPESTEAQRLVCIAILLEHKSNLPKGIIEKMANDSKTNPVVYRLLRELVVRHAYLNHIQADDRQWLQSKLGLTMQYQRTIQRNKSIRK